MIFFLFRYSMLGGRPRLRWQRHRRDEGLVGLRMRQGLSRHGRLREGLVPAPRIRQLQEALLPQESLHGTGVKQGDWFYHRLSLMR